MFSSPYDTITHGYRSLANNTEVLLICYYGALISQIMWPSVVYSHKQPTMATSATPKQQIMVIDETENHNVLCSITRLNEPGRVYMLQPYLKPTTSISGIMANSTYIHTSIGNMCHVQYFRTPLRGKSVHMSHAGFWG